MIVWANDGGEKVVREEVRPVAETNHAWDGKKIRLSGARGETVAFVLGLGAPDKVVADVSVKFKQRPVDDAEIFYTDYLAVEGISRMQTDPADAPKGVRMGKHYPDIAVPISYHAKFTIEKGQSESLWIDLPIPRKIKAGPHRGALEIKAGAQTQTIPVELDVRDFTLPEHPSAKTMVYYSMENVHERYLGKKYPEDRDLDAARELRDRHFRLAHRHRISLIDDNCPNAPKNRPCDEWKQRLGDNGVFAISPYGKWSWRDKESARAASDDWVGWFKKNAPTTDYFLYLIDEPKDDRETEKLARLVKDNPGPGRALPLFATTSRAPSLDIVGFIPPAWQAVGGKRLWAYNAMRPSTGSFAIEDDGVALWQLAWAQYRNKVERWFYWESTYYDDFHSGKGKTDVFHSARTFGRPGWNYANGEGVLFYPGTDRVFPRSSYGAATPFASWRLKEWRRGLQDVDYLTLAEKKDPARVRALAEEMTGANWPTDPERWHAAREALAKIIEGPKPVAAPAPRG